MSVCERDSVTVSARVSVKEWTWPCMPHTLGITQVSGCLVLVMQTNNSNFTYLYLYLNLPLYLKYIYALSLSLFPLELLYPMLHH